MELATIKPCTIAELEAAPELPALLAEYAVESAIRGMPAPRPVFEMYRAMEQTGAFFALGAYKGDELVGFLLFLVSVLPHYGAKAGVSESFFVAAAHRAGGTGKRLVDVAESHATVLGAVGFFLSAPLGGSLDAAASGFGYRPTNLVHFKGLV